MPPKKKEFKKPVKVGALPVKVDAPVKAESISSQFKFTPKKVTEPTVGASSFLQSREPKKATASYTPTIEKLLREQPVSFSRYQTASTSTSKTAAQAVTKDSDFSRFVRDMRGGIAALTGNELTTGEKVKAAGMAPVKAVVGLGAGTRDFFLTLQVPKAAAIGIKMAADNIAKNTDLETGEGWSEYMAKLTPLFGVSDWVGDKVFSTKTAQKFAGKTSEVANALIEVANEKQKARLGELGIDETTSIINPEKFGYGVSSGLSSIAFYMGVIALTKSPVVASASLGWIEGSETYLKARETYIEEGMNQDKAESKAAALALIESGGIALLEKVGMDALFRSYAGGKMRNAAISAITETLQESTQTVWSNLVTKYGYDKTQSLYADLFDTVITTLPVGFLGGAMRGGTDVDANIDTDLPKPPEIEPEDVKQAAGEVTDATLEEARKFAEMVENPQKVDEVTNALNEDIKEAVDTKGKDVVIEQLANDETLGYTEEEAAAAVEVAITSQVPPDIMTDIKAALERVRGETTKTTEPQPITEPQGTEGVFENIPEDMIEEAQEAWDDTYGQSYAELEQQVEEINTQLKTAQADEKKALEAQKEELVKQQIEQEQTFIREQQEKVKAKTKEKIKKAVDEVQKSLEPKDTVDRTTLPKSLQNDLDRYERLDREDDSVNTDDLLRRINVSLNERGMEFKWEGQYPNRTIVVRQKQSRFSPLGKEVRITGESTTGTVTEYFLPSGGVKGRDELVNIQMPNGGTRVNVPASRIEPVTQKDRFSIKEDKELGYVVLEDKAGKNVVAGTFSTKEKAQEYINGIAKTQESGTVEGNEKLPDRDTREPIRQAGDTVRDRDGGEQSTERGSADQVDRRDVARREDRVGDTSARKRSERDVEAEIISYFTGSAAIGDAFKNLYNKRVHLKLFFDGQWQNAIATMLPMEPTDEDIKVYNEYVNASDEVKTRIFNQLLEHFNRKDALETTAPFETKPEVDLGTEKVVYTDAGVVSTTRTTPIAEKQNTKIGKVIVDIIKSKEQDLRDESLFLTAQAEGFMPLTIERLPTNELAVSHTFTQNGDLMRDPEVVFLIDKDGQLQAQTIENPPMVLNGIELIGPRPISPRDNFLNLWADNIRSQGFVPKAKKPVKVDPGKVNREQIKKLEADMRAIYLGVGDSDIEGFAKADEVMSQIITELEIAEPGDRIISPDGVIAYPSTFPAWIPDAARNRDDLNALINMFRDVRGLSYPSKTVETKRREFADAFFDEMDFALKVNTKPLREQILKLYDIDNIITAGQEVSEVGQNSAPRNQEGATPERTSEGYTNEEIENIIKDYAYLDVANRVQLTNDRVPTKEQLRVVNAWQPAGGREAEGAEGRGLLDEYYTPGEVVEMVRTMLDRAGAFDQYPITVLEPSVGIGNFLYAVPEGSKITAYEINETSARLAKLNHPTANVVVQPFEELFVDKRGNKKEIDYQYEIIVGNPPYGSHRGVYKGLGEEAKISRYETYFMKRSLDLTVEGGYMAMVVPSSFLRSSMKEPGKEQMAALGELVEAIRLPNGTFATTDIGTDILVFRKSSTKELTTIDNRVRRMSGDAYFLDQANAGRILGEKTQKTGRFGVEDAVKGDLESAQKAFEAVYEPEAPIRDAEIVDAPTVTIDDVLTASPEKLEKIASEPSPVQKVAQREQARRIEQKSATDLPAQEEMLKKLDLKTGDKVQRFHQGQTQTGTLTKEEGSSVVQVETESGELVPVDENWYKQDEVAPLTSSDTLDLATLSPESVKDGQWEYVSATGELEGNFDPKRAFYMGGKYYNAFNYTQGDIYAKLAQLEKDKKTIGAEQYEKQKTMLEAVLPPRMTVDRMRIPPHAHFTEEVKFDVDVAGEKVKKSLQSMFIEWIGKLPVGAFGESSRRSVQQYVFGEAVRGGDKLQNEQDRRTRRIEGDKLFKVFLTEELSDAQKKQVEDEYNRRFNSYSKPDYSLVPLVSKISATYKGDKLDLREIQRQGIGFLLNKGVGLLAHDVGLGKDQPLSAEILTPSGWKTMGQMKVGQTVITKKGTPAKVTGVFPQGKKPVYVVHFNDGVSTECGEEHLWSVQTPNKRAKYKSQWLTLTTKELIENGLYNSRGDYMYSIPVVKPVDLEERPVFIHPYVMGVLLGDGSLSTNSIVISNPEKDIITKVMSLLPDGITLTKIPGKNCDYRVVQVENRGTNSIKAALTTLNLKGKRSHDKFIPIDYLQNSLENRIALLQGLLDTDGYVAKEGGTVQYTTASPTLKDDVSELVWSLGGTVRESSKIPTYTYKNQKKVGQLAYTLTINLPSSVTPVTTKKKLERVIPKTKYTPTRYIKSIEFDRYDDTQCIMVDDETHTYVTDQYIVTHNTMQGIIANIELINRGWAKRPLVVLPSASVYAQWVKDFRALKPDIKINELSNLGRDFKGDLATLSIPDGTISVITEEGFKKLGFSDATYKELTKDMLDVIENPNDGKKTKRAKELKTAKAEETIGKAMKGTSAERTFEDLGFDAITVDEIHNYNHIIGSAKAADDKATEYRGFSQQPSISGLKLWLAAQFIMQKNNGRNVIGLSATPFTNHPLEYYSILSLFARKRMQQMGIRNVNDFMAMYMDVTAKNEVTADGQIASKLAVRGFNNAQQFQQLLREFIDFRDGEEAGIKRPNRQSRTFVVKENRLSYDYKQMAQSLFEIKEGGTLMAMTELQQIAFSPYASQFHTGPIPTPKQFVEGSPKVKLATDLLAETYFNVPNSNHIVYSHTGKDFLPMIKEYLVKEKGIPADQIQIITGDTAKPKRTTIQNDFNAGKVRIIIGNVAIEEGINLQERTTDMYLLSQPWNFTAVRQVIGRAWRQGNKWNDVRINQFFTENTFDIYMSQALEKKRVRYEQSLKQGEDYVDSGDVDYDEMKFALMTDPVLRTRQMFSEKRQLMEQEIKRIKSDFATRNRRAKEYVDAIAKVNEYKDYIVRYPDTSWAKGSLRDAEEKLVRVKQNLTERGIDVASLDKDLLAMEAMIADLELNLKNFATDEEEAVKKAKIEAETQVDTSGTEDYAARKNERKDDDKALFDYQPQFQAVYHGSPHEYDHPSLDYVGSGEGQQAYGWGYYVTEKEEIAKYYKKTLTEEKNKVWVKGEEKINLRDPQAILKEYFKVGETVLAYGNSRDKVVSLDLDNRRGWEVTVVEVDKNGNEIDAPRTHMTYPSIEYLEKIFPERGWKRLEEGYLYEMEVKDEAVESMLLWDEPFVKQPQVVQQALEKILTDKYGKIGSTMHAGQTIYRMLAADFSATGNGEKKASLWLLSNGVRGIKYKTGSTRNKTDRADYNYVVFDTSDIKVLRRNGVELTQAEKDAMFARREQPRDLDGRYMTLQERRAKARSLGFVADTDLKRVKAATKKETDDMTAAEKKQLRADKVYAIRMRAGSYEDAKVQLERYMRRFGIQFDVDLADRIFVQGSKIRDKIMAETQAYAVYYNRAITLTPEMLKTTADHEFIHLVIDNLAKIKAFEGFTKESLYTAANGGKSIAGYTDGQRRALEEKIAVGFERYLIEKALDRQAREKKYGKPLADFYEKLKNMVVDLVRNLGGSFGELADFYDTVARGQVKNEKTVVLMQNPVRKAQVAYQTDEGLSYLDFEEIMTSKKDLDNAARAAYFSEVLEVENDEVMTNKVFQNKNKLNFVKKDLNTLEDITAQARDIYLKDPEQFEQARNIELIGEAHDADKHQLDNTFADLLKPYMDLKPEQRARVNEILWKGDEEGKRFDEGTLIRMSLSAEQITAYYAVRDALDAAHETLLTEMARKGIDEAELDTFRQERTGYMPHRWIPKMTTGQKLKSFVTGKDVFVVKHQRKAEQGGWETYHMDAFATEKEAEEAQKHFRENTPKEFLTEESPARWVVDKLSSLEVDFFSSQELTSERMIAVIEQMREKKFVKDEIVELLKNNVMTMFKEKGFGRHYLRRSGVRGYDTDNTELVIADYFSGFAGYVTKLRWSTEYFVALSQVDARRQQRFYAWLRDLIAYKLNNNPEWRIARTIAFTWYLANDLSYLLTNMTQNVIVGLGELSKYVEGKDKAWKPEAYMIKAVKDWATKNVTAEEAAAINGLLEKGQLGAEMTVELMGFKNNPLYREISSTFSKVMYGSTAIVEREVNRIPAFLAARRIFREQGFSETIANAKALEVSNDIHFRYGRIDRPRMMRGRVNVLFIFQNYIRTFLYQLYRDASRREFIALTRKMGYTFALGGASALPFAGLFWSILKGIGDDEDDEELKKELSTWDILIQRGIPATFDVDLSTRVGIELLSVTKISDNPTDVRVYLGSLGDLLFKRPVEVMDLIGQQRYLDAWAKALPDVLANPIRAYNGYTYGVRSINGVPLLDLDGEVYKYSTWEAIIKATGFTPTQEAILWDEKAKEWKRDEEQQEKRTEISRTIRGMVQRGEFEEARQLQDDAKEAGIIAEKTDYIRDFAKDEWFQEAVTTWETGNKTREELDAIEEELIEKVYGGVATDDQRNNVRKELAIYRQFGLKNENVNDIMKAATNADKVKILLEIKDNIGQEAFDDFIQNGRTGIYTEAGNRVPILFSDDLMKLLREEERKYDNQN